ncbi:MAG: hypothetical protein AAFX87_17505 [Bacteroidota bacterium]
MKKLLPILLLTIWVGQASAQKRIDELSFLLGDFDVTVLLPQASGEWVKGGGGQARFYPILDDTFIREDLNLNFGQGTLTMSNSIGRDGRMNQLRMIAMDKEFANIDIYKGEFSDGKIVFDNLTSDIPATTASGQPISFRITYSKISAKENQSLVEMTTDQGKSWRPYSKQVFTRK